MAYLRAISYPPVRHSLRAWAPTTFPNDERAITPRLRLICYVPPSQHVRENAPHPPTPTPAAAAALDVGSGGFLFLSAHLPSVFKSSPFNLSNKIRYIPIPQGNWNISTLSHARLGCVNS